MTISLKASLIVCERLRPGTRIRNDTIIGPTINKDQFDRLMTRIHEAVGGEPQGLVLPPHVFVDFSNDHALAREEIFGSVAPIIQAKDEKYELQMTNATTYGLSSHVHKRCRAGLCRQENP